MPVRPSPRCRVQRLMRQQTASGAPSAAGKPWRRPRPDPAALQRRPDLVNRDFTAAGAEPAVGWRLHYLRCWEGRRVLQLRDRRLLAARSSAGSSPRTCAPTLVLDALRMALGDPRSPALTSQLMHHSDARQPIYVGCDYTPGARRPPGARRRSARSATPMTTRMAESFVDTLQDRADQRSRLADPIPARARDRRIRRLVQQRPAARVTRRPAARRDRSRMGRLKRASATNPIPLGARQSCWSTRR